MTVADEVAAGLRLPIRAVSSISLRAVMTVEVASGSGRPEYVAAILKRLT
jgi:hypothetical protein